MSDIRRWLKILNLGKYAELFSENDIDLAALPHITEDDLKELGVTLGARRKLVAAIAELRTYQNNVAGEIARYEGHVAKFMGDRVGGLRKAKLLG